MTTMPPDDPVQPKTKRQRRPAPMFPAIVEHKQRLAAMLAIGRAIEPLPKGTAIEVLQAALDHAIQLKE